MRHTIQTLFFGFIFLLGIKAFAAQDPAPAAPDTAQEQAPGKTDTEAEEEDLENLEVKNPFRAQLPEKKKEEPPLTETSPDVVKGTGDGSGSGSTRPLPRNTKTPPPKPVTPPTLKITGLIWNTDRPQAIINNQIVDVGDSVDNSEIIAIRQTGVDVLYQGQKFTVIKK